MEGVVGRDLESGPGILHKAAMMASSSSDGSGSSDMTAQEAARLSAALDSREGKELLQAFLAAHADPTQRAEQDAYLRQLEQEEGAGAAAPEGKELVWPRADGFVAKARRCRSRRGGGVEETEKLFVNVVLSERLPPPEVVAEEGTGGGSVWHVPNALGPPRVEKDKGAYVVECWVAEV